MNNREESFQEESFSDEDWLDTYANQERTRMCASTSLKTFDQFCQKQIGLNGKSRDTMIKKYKAWFEPKKVKDADGDYYYPKPDVRSICLSLSKFIKFMSVKHDDIVVYTNPKTGKTITVKAKNPKSIKLYFGYVKSYLRVCHAIKLSLEDIKDYVKIEKPLKEERQPIPLPVLKTILHHANPLRRCMYLCLISSGMRIGELLSLKKSNFFVNEIPVRVKLHAKDTKTNESRETYISSEAFEKLKPILDSKGEDEYVFHILPTVYGGVKNEVKYFMRLRRRLNLDGRVEGSNRALYSLHGMRGYFHTIASHVNGEQWSNRILGHTGYLPNYYQLSTKEKGDMYLKVEPRLWVEAVVLESEKNKDKIIEGLTERLEKMEDMVRRLDLLK